ncbi:hypothetical protein DY000_02023918 [Brassica cretica]|uniref:Uncharacterized protein n=1 Tax=Brassica cretica TaxID=69181 RepID=A0ABQ7EHX5_BRACR|nr:hypothetical protein DY000_02023918 [Brassica cretica]
MAFHMKEGWKILRQCKEKKEEDRQRSDANRREDNTWAAWRIADMGRAIRKVIPVDDMREAEGGGGCAAGAEGGA